MSQMIIAERRLQASLRKAARESLGANATDEEVQVAADRAYYGPPMPKRNETGEERRARREQHERNVADARGILRANGLL